LRGRRPAWPPCGRTRPRAAARGSSCEQDEDLCVAWPRCGPVTALPFDERRAERNGIRHGLMDPAYLGAASVPGWCRRDDHGPAEEFRPPRRRPPVEHLRERVSADSRVHASPMPVLIPSRPRQQRLRWAARPGIFSITEQAARPVIHRDQIAGNSSMLRAWAASGLVDVWKFTSGRLQQPPRLLDCQPLRRSPPHPARQSGMGCYSTPNCRPWRDGLQAPDGYARSTAIVSTTALVGATGFEPVTPRL